jgi:hypothetical protein
MVCSHHGCLLALNTVVLRSHPCLLLQIAPGDAVSCVLDMEDGVLKMSRNGGPVVKVRGDMPRCRDMDGLACSTRSWRLCVCTHGRSPVFGVPPPPPLCVCCACPRCLRA